MIKILRNNIEYILLILLYAWVGLCSIINMGSIAASIFLVLVVLIASKSARASFCLLISLLFSSMSSLNMPSPIMITSIIIILLNFTRFDLSNKRQVLSRLLIPYFLFVLLRLLSSVIARNSELFSYAISIDFITLLSLSVTIFLVNNENDVDFVARWFGIIGVLATILGFVYFLYNDNTYIGQLYSSSSLAKKGIIGESYLDQSWLRWVPADKEPNFWAANLLMPMAYWLNETSKKMNLLSLVCLIITILGIFGTYSRSSFLISLLMILITLSQSKPKYVFISICAIIVVFIGIYLYFPTFVDRILTIQDNIRFEGASGRFFLWGEALDNFWSSPIWGIGAGQTPAYSISHLGTHNLFLQILGESGILGFILFSSLWFRPLVEMKRWGYMNNFFYFALLAYSLNSLMIHNFDLRLPFFVIVLFYMFKISKSRKITKL